MTPAPANRSAAESSDLGGLSEAEWEYAYRFADHLSVGDLKPDPTGFDPQRVAVIEQTLRRAWRSYTEPIRRRRRR